MQRKTVLIIALASALVVALGIIITDESVREKLGSTYYFIALAIIGGVAGVLAAYVWDRALTQRLKELRDTAQTAASGPAGADGPGAEPDGDPDEIIGLARQIERMARALQRVEASYRGIVEDQVDLICR